ncbi:sulfatase-like hydrolase/transferase [Haloarcula litorea]|uniref:sulfatase-like hydrolase/transferase n=1 Tax=Haloarcula litorea TaxID=3032579 RepID=UPI0023E87926|nr:sulfatase-like hydrolase/transferase [Halomicroarcula sp. GDY20]
MADRPNIVLLLTDQERYDVASGDRDRVATPNLDRLSAEGMTFERAYTPIGICTSARASLLTGLYPHNHGMLNNCHEPDAIEEDLSTDLPTFGTLLAENGYDNSYAGKWHVGRTQTPEDFGFDYLGGGDGSHDDEDTDFREYQRELGVSPEDAEIRDPIYTDQGTDPVLIAGETTIPKEATRTYYLAEQTIERIERADEDDEPLFHRTDFVGPHHPYLVPEPYASMYDPADIERWGNFDETFDGKPRVHEKFLEYRGVADIDWETWAEAVSKYFGFVTFIDEQIGRILDAIEEHLGDDTAVVHAADHGDFTGSHRQFNKGPMMYEEVYHIPMLVRWPGTVEPGSNCTEFVRLLDLMPTFLEMGGVEPPADVDGRSLVPLLEGTTPADWPESVFAEYHGEEFGLYSQRMVRTDRYKYVHNAPDRNELYDLEHDPDELRNLAEHPEYQSVRDDLEATLLDWMTATDDPITKWTEKVLTADDSGRMPPE